MAIKSFVCSIWKKVEIVNKTFFKIFQTKRNILYIKNDIKYL